MNLCGPCLRRNACGKARNVVLSAVRMLRHQMFGLALVGFCMGCAPPRPAPPPEAPKPEPAKVRELPAAGPQCFTPEAKPKGRSHAVTPLWATRVGMTDYRSTMVLSQGALYVSTRDGIVVLDPLTGARKGAIPSGQGPVVGLAMDGDRIASTTKAGDVVMARRSGAVVWRASLGAEATTPPTLVDVDGDGVFDVAVGDARGRVVVLRGDSGRVIYARPVGEGPRAAIGAGLAAHDLDGDGVPEIVAGAESGALVALRGRTGEPLWSVSRASALRAAPLLADVDADRTVEVIAGWADGDLAIVDGKTGREIWTAHVEEDNGDPTGLIASPTPLPGMRVGVLVVPTARWGAEDSVVLMGAHDRNYKSQQGRVVTSPIVGKADQESEGLEALVGTERGDIVAFDAAGHFSHVYQVQGAVTAPLMFADLECDGTEELLVLDRTGTLTALALHVAFPPLLARARGSHANDGVLPAADLGWRLP
jgi:outer membrane protein assembly factor BamB